jgi:hypothetical protein
MPTWRRRFGIVCTATGIVLLASTCFIYFRYASGSAGQHLQERLQHAQRIIVLAERAGYDPFGLPEVLRDLGRFARDDEAVAQLFRTHPLPQARLAELDRAMGDRFEAVTGAALAPRLYRLRR